MSKIFAVKIEKTIPDPLFQQFLCYVGTEKEERIKKFRRREDAERTLIGDVLVRSIVCDHFYIDNRDLAFINNKYGKPFLSNIPDFNYNISHSGKWVVCGIDALPIGVDIEHIRPVDFSIAERFFSENEYSDLMKKTGDNRLCYFYDLWTLKESYIKAKGKGLSLPLNSFSIHKNRTEITINTQIGEQWHFQQYMIDPDYRLSVCSCHPGFPEQVIILTPSELAGKITT